MRQATINVYKFEELSEKARNKAHCNFQNTDSYCNSYDQRATLKALQSIFPINVTSWEYGGYQFHFKFTFLGEEKVQELTVVRLATYINNNYHADLFKGKYYSTKGKFIDGKYTYKNRRSKTMFDNECVLTGFYLDDIILAPIYEFLKNPHDDLNFKQLMYKCLNEWVKACHDDFNDYYSIENFKDMCEANEWEFYADGRMFF